MSLDIRELYVTDRMFPLTILCMFIIYSTYCLFLTFSHLSVTNATTSYSTSSLPKFISLCFVLWPFEINQDLLWPQVWNFIHWKLMGSLVGMQLKEMHHNPSIFTCLLDMGKFLPNLWSIVDIFNLVQAQ